VIDAGKDSRIYAGLSRAPLPTVSGGGSRTELWRTISHPSRRSPVKASSSRRDGARSGGDVVVFEIQQNSDTTFRLYDWGHVDTKTGKPRALQVDQALAALTLQMVPRTRESNSGRSSSGEGAGL